MHTHYTTFLEMSSVSESNQPSSEQHMFDVDHQQCLQSTPKHSEQVAQFKPGHVYSMILFSGDSNHKHYKDTYY